MSETEKVVVRMAPSPTGSFHIGGARTALFNYLFAKETGGKFILRIEDTDKERSKKEFEENILESFIWLGLSYDEMYRQSERGEIYKKHLKEMVENGYAYVSKEEKGDREEVIRFKNPNKKISFDDLVRGRVEFDTAELGDFVIAKSLEEPLYHLAVVVDDHESGVTHVIRGEDHISNTPRQILIQEAIGAERPVYAHLPLILAPDRSKFSKRHGAVAVTEYRERGYQPEALLNYLSLLGWNPGTDKEIFTLEELVEQFDLSRVQKGGAVFDEKKLRWVNKQHMVLQSSNIKAQISKLLEEEFNAEIHPKITETVFERIETLGDVDELLGAHELDYFFSEPAIEKEKISWKNIGTAETAENLEKTLEILESEEDLDAINNKIMAFAERVGKGGVLWPLRYSLSGKERSPDPFTLMTALGREESARRVRRAVEILK